MARRVFRDVTFEGQCIRFRMSGNTLKVSSQIWSDALSSPEMNPLLARDRVFFSNSTRH